MITRIPLQHITANPFQTRDDVGDVSELARSIRKFKYTHPETSGLLQIPPARIWDGGTEQPLSLDTLDSAEIPDLVMDNHLLVIQLACGHRRWAAFDALLTGKFDMEADPAYTTFPVDLQYLSDQAMADIAWEENARRRDLSPIEEAQALKQAIARFGYTQEQIGSRWRLSRSAVANKLRLLNLPDDAQYALHTGQITERHGRILLAAQAKSPVIYDYIATTLIAQPVSEETAKIARQILESTQKVYSHYYAGAGNNKRCAACDGPLDKENRNVRLWSNDDKWKYLCPDCYRAVIDWQPPVVADAERILRDATDRFSRNLDHAYFPLDRTLPDQSEAVQSDTCISCRYKEGKYCFDAQCYASKETAFLAYQRRLLLERLRADYPERAEWTIVEGLDSHGWHMRRDLAIDGNLVHERCPGCEKSILRYDPYDVRPYFAIYNDLPFIWACAHGATHNACVRRWEREHTSQKGAREEQDRHMHLQEHQRAKRLFDRAAGVLSNALLDGHEGAWHVLSGYFDLYDRPSGNDNDALTAYYARSISLSILRAASSYKRIDAGEVDYEYIERRIRVQLAHWGLPFPSFADDGDLRQELTPAQINGNLDNLQQAPHSNPAGDQ